MSERFAPRIGAVFSADIAVPEHEREVSFYSRVLRTGEDPLWRDDLMSNLGVPIIGLGPQSPAYGDLPLQWMPHIQVADVAASAQRAQDLGGAVLLHQKSDDGTSEWAVLRDPAGAAFGIIPLVPAAPPDNSATAGAGANGSVGCIAWLDLTVPDAATVRDFYRHVVGWTVQDLAMQDGDGGYTDFIMLDGNGNPAAGVCHARGTNVDLPPVWMIYLPVGDLAESIRLVEQDGGTVIKAQRGANGEYVYAAIRDPVGATLALMPG